MAEIVGLIIKKIKLNRGNKHLFHKDIGINAAVPLEQYSLMKND